MSKTIAIFELARSTATVANERDRGFRPRRPWFGYRFTSG